jgi:signal transduction histidine kinase/ActR/RegA family two-component response regulator
MSQGLPPEANGLSGTPAADVVGPDDGAAILTGLGRPFFVLEPTGRVGLHNQEAARFFRAMSGRDLHGVAREDGWRRFPEVADSTFATEYRKSREEGRAFHLETYAAHLQRWFEYYGTHAPAGLWVTVQDVTHLAELDKALRRRIEELAEADRGKEEFLVQLAHEVRNGLAPVRNALHVWREQAPRGDDEPARALAEAEVAHLSGLLDELLRECQPAGGRPPARESVDLSDLVGEALRDALGSGDGRGRNFSTSLPPEPVLVAGDRGLLRQMLGHLVGNAARHTRPGDRIAVELSRADGQAVVEVRDTGVGIAAEDLPRVFRLFMRAAPPEDRRSGGLVIGLPLARRVAELHGGTLDAASDGIGRGSRFVVHLPLLTALADETTRVLIVDNSREAADSIALLVRLWGFGVRVVYDPFTALEEARGYRPDILLLDIGMPGMDGYELARLLRRQGETKDAVLIAITGYAQEEDREQAIAAGFNYHMAKPVDPDDLHELLTLITSGKSAPAGP